MGFYIIRQDFLPGLAKALTKSGQAKPGQTKKDVLNS